MKGNNEDCICAGEHTERCDAYRLSEFMKKAAREISIIDNK